MYLPRALEKEILDISEAFPVILVSGPRQAGKTTLLQHLAEKNRRYVSLDLTNNRELAKTAPRTFIETYPPPVLIDEVQYAPELFPYIKAHVDEHKNPGAFWLTGSQMFQLMKGVSESMSGRVGIIPLLGLSYSEIKGYANSPFSTEFAALRDKADVRHVQTTAEIFTAIVKGAMPQSLYPTFRTDVYYESYVTTYLERDIRDLSQVGDLLQFRRFMTACAAHTGCLLNYSNLAQDTGISMPTAKRWLSFLVSSGIVTLLEPYYNNALKRMTKSPKLYFLDTGLAAYLSRWENAAALEVSAVSGRFFETYVVSEVIKSFYNAGKRPPLFYYRDRVGGTEIDLIVERNGTLFPLEIKKSSEPGRSALKGFSALEYTGMPIGAGGVICTTPDLLPFDENNWMIPVGLV